MSPSPRLVWWKRLSVRRCLHGYRLPCGCVVGVYEQYVGSTVEMIDHHDPGCKRADHTRDAVVPRSAAGEAPRAGPG